MPTDILKNFDDEVTKNEELQKSKEVTTEVTEVAEDAVKSTEPKVTEDVKVEDVAKSDDVTEAVVEEKVEKSTEPKEDEPEDTEKADDTEAEDKDKEDATKSEAVKSEDKEDVEKSNDFDVEALLEVVVKSYAQVVAQVSNLQKGLDVLTGNQEAFSKSIEDLKLTPAQVAEPIKEEVAKSVEVTEVVTPVEDKAVGFVEKSVVSEDELEGLSKSNVDTAPTQEVQMDEVKALFTEKFQKASKNIKNARDENELKIVVKSWTNFINDNETPQDVERINNFINS